MSTDESIPDGDATFAMPDGGNFFTEDTDDDGDYEVIGSDFDADGQPEIIQFDADGDGSLESLDFPGMDG